MANFNKVILAGNVTKNPEVRYTNGGGVVARFGIAVNRRFKTGDSVQNEVCFIDIIAFSKLAEFIGSFVVKGMPILVEGRLSYNTWEQDGVKKSRHEIVAESVQLLDKKGDKQESVEEDIPF